MKKIINNKKLYKKFISLFLSVMMISTISFSWTKVSAATTTIDSTNGNWGNKNVTLANTSEAQLMVRAGDIDNFGYDWGGINPFSGNNTSIHGLPFYPSSDPDGTDRIMVVSGYSYNSNYKTTGTNRDGYTEKTSRSDQNGSDNDNVVRPIYLRYSDSLTGISVQNATIQMFVDDFQPGNAKGVKDGTVSYKATINGQDVPELSNIINNLDESGPIGKLITFKIPDRYLDLVRTGIIYITIDDTRTGRTGDGYAIDFVKLLINKTGITNTAMISGNVKDKNNRNIVGATVSAGGVAETLTDANGNYVLNNVPAGQAILIASKTGYNSQTYTETTVIGGWSYPNRNFTLASSTPPTTPVISVSPTTVTNNKVTVTINYSSDSTIKEYRINIGDATGEWKTYTIPFDVTENCNIEARGTNEYGNVSAIASYTVSNIVSMQEVTMEVSDSAGTINKKYNSTINSPDYTVNNNGETYKLYGQSNVAIDVKDPQATHLKYRFVKDGQVSTEDDWEYMELNGADVDTTNEGKLTQMPYDVSHMPLMNNNTMWSNRNEVYKTPFADKTGLIITGITDQYTHYVTSESLRDKDGKLITRWVPKTLFVKDQSVEAYANGYKEARKTWGYIKVNQTGDYYFKAYSDDGFYGTITVNGELKVLGNAFAPRGVKDAGLDATDSIALEAGKYYPIYLEYFNWGGNAAFEIKARLNNENNYELIDSAESHCTLYPSKSDSPIENGNNIFMGAKNINFKTEPGKYTIQYALLKEKNTGTTQKEYDEISRGSFGKFEVEERFDGLSKTFSKNPIQKGEEFYINYNLTPKPIKLTDLYKGDTIPSTLSPIYVNNLILTDTLPDGLINVENNNSKSINKVLDKIEYKYNSQTGNYEASSYTFSIKVKTDLNVDKVSFSTSGQIDYRDVSLNDDSRISQTQYFSDIPVLNVNGEYSVILKHGIYDTSSTDYINENNLNVVNTMPTALAMLVDVKSSNPVINWSIDDITKISNAKIQFNQYEILNGSTNQNTKIGPLEFNAGNIAISNSNGFNMEKGKKYIIVYTITPKDSATESIIIGANIEGSNSKPLTLDIKALPDLF